MAESLRRKAIKINKNIRGEKLIGSAGEAFTLFSLNMMGVEADLVKAAADLNFAEVKRAV